MSPFPDDIFTEQTADPDTLANLGPLRRLAGVWESSAGVDINPKPEGPQRREYRERIELQPIDAQSNGPQLFYGLRYHTHILASDEEATFHDQVGYWLWEPATGLVLQTLTIPRGQVAIAAGHATPDAAELVLTAQRGQTGYGICSTTFLEWAFRTESYRIEVVFNPDGSWSYVL
ncbi:MAG TPA: heme-binding beta-barrel domain-containing protein, partial [Steroidobacteraceae bacterium]|nr:heme-binding beta-barrel domain-containing protein [Steroidobacteraceae bacterium]